MLTGGLAANSGVASADGTTYPPPDLFNLSALQLPATLPPELGGGYYAAGVYSATPAQVTSLQDLESEAVNDTVQDHALASSDTEAVESWARPDAEAELWGLLVQAIQAVDAGSASTDQQDADTWLSAVVQREGVLAAQDAGLEYTKWAGLGISGYQSLISSSAGESAVQTFLSNPPEPYSDGGSSSDPSASADGGYCVYQSPAPYQSDYTTNIYNSDDAPETCYVPCTNLLGCSPPTPSYDEFVEWGEADANDNLFDNSGFATASDAIAVSATLGTVASVGSVGAGVGIGFALASVMGGTAFQTTVFPFAARFGPDYTLETAGAGETSGEASSEAVDGAVDAAAEGGEVAAAGVGAIVGAAIFAISTAVQEGIAVIDAAELPGQLAGLVADAPASTPDLGSMLSNSTQAQGLYSLFVGSTQPSPTFTSCDNTSSGVVIAGPGTTLGATAPCLNATPVPPYESYYPQWVVTPQGSTTSSTQPTITWTDAATQLTSTTYLDGNWFVNTSTVAGTQAIVQSLRLQYTDWNGNENTAWLFDNASSPEFLVIPDSALGPNFDASTCLTSGSCSLTPTIDMVGADGTDFSASATSGSEAPPPGATPPLCAQDNIAGCTDSLNPTTTTLTSSPTDADEGQSVTLTATISDPNATGTVNFVSGSTDLCSNVPVQQVEDQSSGGAGIILITSAAEATCSTTFSTPGSVPVFANYSGGAPTGFLSIDGGSTWDESSQGGLTLEVIDQVATTTSVSASPSTPVVGQLVNYTATVSDSGGTGPTPGGTVTFTNGTTTVCSDVPLSSAGSASCAQAYQATGDETVTATYSGDSGTLTSSGQAGVSVGQAQSFTIVQPSLPNPVVGQPVSYTAQVMLRPPDTEGPAPTGTVTFTAGNTTLCSDAPLSTTNPISATCSYAYQASGNENVTASYSGDSATQPSSGQAGTSVRPAASSTSVSASTSTPVVGQVVTFTATVAVTAPDTNGPAPTGTVTFVNGPVVCSDVALSSSAPYTATCSQTYRGPGAQMMQAQYSGDTATLHSQGQAGVSVSKASSNTSVSASTSTPVVGQPVTYTATVTVTAPDTNGPAPTGKVTFTNGTTTVCSAVVLSTSTPYTASCSDSYQAPGNETMTATYNGDTATLTSSGQAAVPVAQAASSTSVSASTSVPVVGQPVTYTATVTVTAPDTNGPAPTGTVTFASGTTTVCAAVALPPTAPYTATCSQTYGAPGAEVVTATYNGDANTISSIGQGGVNVAPAPSSTQEAASTSTPVVGQPVTYTATVAVLAPDTDGPNPTGTVTFTEGSTTICSNVALSASGAATCSQTYQAPGQETVEATYSGDNNTLSSAGQAGVTVAKAASALSLSASPGSPTFGQVVTLKAQVAAVAPATAGPAPTGTVTFDIDGQQVGPVVALSGADAQSTPITNLAPGSHEVTATYSGDTNYVGSAATTEKTVTCSQTISAAFNGTLTVTGSACVEGVTVDGAIKVRPGGTLALVGATVHGTITATGAASVLICGSSLSGPVVIDDPSGPVTLGGPAGSSCAADKVAGSLTVGGAGAPVSMDDSTVTGPLTLLGNNAAVSLSDDTVTGPLTADFNSNELTVTGVTVNGELVVAFNSGTVTVSSNKVSGSVTVSFNGSSTAPIVSANSVGGPLVCSLNSPAPSDAGTANKVVGRAQDQCAKLA